MKWKNPKINTSIKITVLFKKCFDCVFLKDQLWVCHCVNTQQPSTNDHSTYQWFPVTQIAECLNLSNCGVIHDTILLAGCSSSSSVIVYLPDKIFNFSCFSFAHDSKLQGLLIELYSQLVTDHSTEWADKNGMDYTVVKFKSIIFAVSVIRTPAPKKMFTPTVDSIEDLVWSYQDFRGTIILRTYWLLLERPVNSWNAQLFTLLVLP